MSARPRHTLASAVVVAALGLCGCRVFGIYGAEGIPCFDDADCDPGVACVDRRCDLVGGAAEGEGEGGEGEGGGGIGEGEGGEGEGGTGEGEGEGEGAVDPCSDAALTFGARITVRATPFRCDATSDLAPGATLRADFAESPVDFDTPMPGHVGDLAHLFGGGDGVTVSLGAPIDPATTVFAVEIVGEASSATFSATFIADIDEQFSIGDGAITVGGIGVPFPAPHPGAWRDTLCFIDMRTPAYVDCYIEGASIGAAPVNIAPGFAFDTIEVGGGAYVGAIGAARVWGLPPDEPQLDLFTAGDRDAPIAMRRFLQNAGVEAHVGTSHDDATARDAAALAWRTSTFTDAPRAVQVEDPSGNPVFVVVAPGWPRVQRTQARGPEILVESAGENLVTQAIEAWNSIGSECTSAPPIATNQSTSHDAFGIFACTAPPEPITSPVVDPGNAPPVVTFSVFMRTPENQGSVTMQVAQACTFDFTAPPLAVTSSCGAVDVLGDWVRLSAPLGISSTATITATTDVVLWWPQVEVGGAPSSLMEHDNARTPDIVAVAFALGGDAAQLQLDARALPGLGRLLKLSTVSLDLEDSGGSQFALSGSGEVASFPPSTSFTGGFGVAVAYGAIAPPTCLTDPCAVGAFAGGKLDGTGLVLGDRGAEVLGEPVGPALLREIVVVSPEP